MLLFFYYYYFHVYEAGHLSVEFLKLFFCSFTPDFNDFLHPVSAGYVLER